MNWKTKCQRWLTSGLLASAWALACSANLAHAQQTAQQSGTGIQSFVSPSIFQSPDDASLAVPEDKATGYAIQASYLPKDDPGVVNALGRGADKDKNLKQAACCGRVGLYGIATGSCGPNGCGGGKCVPGQLHQCSWCDHDSYFGRLACCFYQCLCCPDPCYDPHWVPAANSSFWVDGARPVTTTRIRWDSGLDYQRPDRSEFFWAQQGGKGPPKVGADVTDYNDFALYTEIAAKKFSMFFEVPYRAIAPDLNPPNSGFSDMNAGVKSMVFDCELLQVSFQFRTYLPVGNSGKGLGTGHVSLEPSLIAALKLAPDTYLQAQVAEWVPIGGTSGFASGVMHYHFSLNHVLCRCLPDVPLIGTLECNGYSYQGGAFTAAGTDPNNNTTFGAAEGTCYGNAGPGLRLVVCNKVDFGTSWVYGFGTSGPEQVYRTEFRLRF